MPEDTLDHVWMPVVASLGLVVISRDRHIATKPAELAAFRDHGLRAFWVGGKKDLGNWENLVRLVRAWDKIESIIELRGPGPWFHSITQDSIREIKLRPRTLSAGSDKPKSPRVDDPEQLRLTL